MRCFMNLPPLAAIRAFEAAARHGSFTKAAEELSMTQAAVSYQIKLLEERIGAALFLRRPRHVTLTEVGARLSPVISEAFDMMRAAIAATRENADGVLTITTIPTFAANWLVFAVSVWQRPHDCRGQICRVLCGSVTSPRAAGIARPNASS